MSPKNDKLFKSSVIALLAIYAIFTQVGQVFGTFGAPNFDMVLSSNRAIGEVNGYHVVVTELDGVTLSEPTTLEQVVSEHEELRLSTVKELVTQFGIAYYNQAWDEAEMLRTELEAVLSTIGVASAEYQLIWRVVNPVEKYSLEESVIERVLMTFTFDSSELSSPVELTLR